MGRRVRDPTRAASGPSAPAGVVVLLVLVALALPAASALDPAPDTWPQWRGWDDRRGTAPSSIPTTNETLWSVDVKGQVQGSFAVVDGKALVGSDDGYLYCLDAGNGSELWRFVTDNAIQSTPLVSDGRVYVGGTDGYGYCLLLANGSKVWEFPCYHAEYGITASVVASPALWSGRVYFADQWGGLWSVNTQTGLEVWNDTFPFDIWASPTVVGGRLYLGDITGNFRCYDAATGEELWNRSWAGGEIYATACVHGGRVLVGTGTVGVLQCLDALSGETIWTFYSYFEMYSSAAVSDGVVYVHTWNFLWALPWDDPDGSGNITATEVLWDFQTHDEQGGSSPVVSGDRVVVGSDGGMGTPDGFVFCLNASSGELVWNISLPGYIYASPAVAQGRVYVGSMDNVKWREGYYGTLVCIGRPSSPRLYTTLTPSKTIVQSGQSIDLDVTVLDADGLPAGDAFMHYSATHGELFATFGTVVEGKFKNYWTAPDVGTTTYAIVSATGELPGKEVVGHDIIITVEPAEEPPPVDVPAISHPYLLAGVIAMLAVNAALALLVVRGKREAEGVRS